jgi:hypothetical protein
MGRRARDHVTRRFTTRELQRQTLAVYDELLGGTLAQHFAERYR